MNNVQNVSIEECTCHLHQRGHLLIAVVQIQSAYLIEKKLKTLLFVVITY